MSDSHEIKKIKSVKERLDQVSPTFCMAKWKQVTVLLHNGTTHSCAHPTPHVIPLEEIKSNPSALHNTNYKKEQRKLMLEGKRPSECQYCWNIEDSGEFHSDRHIKSSEFWAREEIEQTAQMPWNENVKPSYLEISFSNVCQFKCSYCFPQVSSKWMKEIQEFGPYEIAKGSYHNLEHIKSSGLMPLEDEHNNPYIEAFWKWLPEMYDSLRMLRITGGEPFMSENTFKMIDWIKKNPNPRMSFAVNSNLGVSDALIQRFIDLSSSLIRDRQVNAFDVFTSVDTSGSQAEYIRNGLNYDKWLTNIERLLDSIPGLKVGIMCTHNAMSVPRFRGLLEDVLSLRKRYQATTSKNWKLWLDIGYVRYPGWQGAKILPSSFHRVMEEDLEYMMSHRGDYLADIPGFYDVEIEKMKRLIAWCKTPFDAETAQEYRRNFYRFFTEQDRRRKTDFLQTFPELRDFFLSLRDNELALQKGKVVNQL